MEGISMKHNRQDETPFNMAMMFYIRLNSLMEKKDYAYIMGNLELWYKSLNAIRRNVEFKFTPQEREIITPKLNLAKKLLKNLKIRNLGNSNQVITQIEEKLDYVDTNILVIMDKHKMIFPNIETIGGLDKLAKRFGLSK